MRKKLFFSIVYFFLLTNIALAQSNTNNSDTISLEKYLEKSKENNYSQDENGYTEDTEVTQADTSTKNEDEEERSIKIDTSYFRQIDSLKWKETKEDKIYKYQQEEIEKPKKKIDPPNFNWLENIFNSGILKFILYAIVIIILFFILYSIFVNSEFDYFKRRNKKSNNKNDTESWENVNEFSDWENALQKALQNSDYKMAVRILYLQTLQKLNAEGFIHYEQEKTNWSYVSELSETTFKKPFMHFTNYFDYVCYGNFEMNKEKYEEIKKVYSQIKKELQF